MASGAERFFASGAWHEGPATATVRNPWDGRPVGEHFVPADEQIGQALAGARRGFAAMAALSHGERGRLLAAVSQGIAAQAEDLARLLCAEAGKPIRQARAEVARAVETFRLGAAEAERLGGELLPLDLLAHNRGRFALSAWLPLGPVLAITPFNFPLNLVAHKLAPALGAGDSVLLKPASATPLTALRLARIAEETGLLPPGALAVLPAPARSAGLASLLADPAVRAVSFTGSAEVGWRLRAAAAGKRAILELGGNAAAIVCADADLERAAAACASAGFAYAGQVCISLQRLLVERRCLDAFLERFLARVAALRCGDPADEQTDLGPLIDAAAADRVGDWIAEARAAGARLLAGGQRAGSLLQPTVLAGVPRDCRLWREEVFGPVVVVEAFDRFDQALALANDSRFGLQAGLFTSDCERVLAAFAALEVGAVIHNDAPSFRADGMPYGGEKDSGLGREGLAWAMRELSAQRALVSAFPSLATSR